MAARYLEHSLIDRPVNPLRSRRTGVPGCRDAGTTLDVSAGPSCAPHQGSDPGGDHAGCTVIDHRSEDAEVAV
jgi:hypothetical protein